MTKSASSLPASSRILCLLAVAVLLAPRGFAQSRSYRDAEQVRRSVGKARQAVEKTGKTIKASAWMALAEKYEDAYRFPLSNLVVGEGNSVRSLVVKGQRPREIMAPSHREGIYRNVYSDKDIYFNADGDLLAIRVTRPVLDTVDVLSRLVESYRNAYAADRKGAYTVAIGDGLSRVAAEYRTMAQMARSLGEADEAERLFLRSAEVSVTPPCSHPDSLALQVAEEVAARERAAEEERLRQEALRASAREILAEGERLFGEAMAVLDEASALETGRDKQLQRLQETFSRKMLSAAAPLRTCRETSDDPAVRERAEELSGKILLFLGLESLDDLGD